MKLFFFILLTTNIFYAQKSIINVEYRLQLMADESLQKKLNDKDYNSFLRDRFVRELEDEDNYLFTLQISDTISRFFISGYTLSDRIEHFDLIGKHPTLSEYSGDSFYHRNIYYYYYNSTKSFIYQPIENNWVLTDETKKIDGYTVYKATSTRTIINPVGTFIFPVVAWYCPEIPYKHGPIGFGNLPGLILHLKYKNAEYQITKINFKPKDKIDIDLFKKYPKKSIDEPIDEESFMPIKN